MSIPCWNFWSRSRSAVTCSTASAPTARSILRRRHCKAASRSRAITITAGRSGRQPSRLSFVVHARRERAGSAHACRHAASFRAGRRAGKAQPRRLRARERTAPKRALAPDRADPQLYAHSPAAGEHPCPRGAAGRHTRLACAGAAGWPRVPPQGQREPRAFHRRSDARRLSLAPALSGEHRHRGLYPRQKPCRLRHPRPRDELLQPPRRGGSFRTRSASFRFEGRKPKWFPAFSSISPQLPPHPAARVG